jgi:hypothetical protein
MKSDVIDLSDLVKAVKFKFNNQDFEIPPIPDDKLKGIMGIANKITKSSREDSEDIAMNEEFIADHNIFLSMAVEKQIDDKTYEKMAPEDFTSWPLKLKNRVMELVFDQIGTSSGEKITPEAEKN